MSSEVYSSFSFSWMARESDSRSQQQQDIFSFLSLSSCDILHPLEGKMAKKKKTALKPVARGFATTSQAKKVVPEPSQEEPAAAEDAVARDTTQEGVAGVNGTDKLNGGLETGEGVDWEDDVKLEQGVFQGYVERLQDKGDREVAKILKVSRIRCRASRMSMGLNVFEDHRL